MKLIVELIIRAFILLLTTYLVPGFHIQSYTSALIVAIVLAILNVLLKPLLLLLTLPLTILTLGLFTFVINAILLLIAANIVKGFTIDSFMTAIIASIVITLLSAVINAFL
ncbi:phage holin family protein [Candidatus Gottesmanbacteria bacterium]|nr:phage holin family protein [Candidatus Gottesmanbacteria bacterium]